MFKKKIAFSALVLVLLSSCNSTGCYETLDVKVYCSFYSIDDKKAVSIDGITVWGVGSDSIIYNNKSLNELALDLNPNAEETRYVIRATADNYTIQDTLTFRHTNQPWFQSMDCGCMVFSTLDTCLITGSIFKSATILDPKIINKKTEHVVLKL